MNTALQVPIERLLLETDSPDGLQPLLRRDASQIVPLPCRPAEASEAQEQKLNHPANIR